MLTYVFMTKSDYAHKNQCPDILGEGLCQAVQGSAQCPIYLRHIYHQRSKYIKQTKCIRNQANISCHWKILDLYAIILNKMCSILFTTKHGFKKGNTVVDNPNKY